MYCAAWFLFRIFKLQQEATAMPATTKLIRLIATADEKHESTVDSAERTTAVLYKYKAWQFGGARKRAAILQKPCAFPQQILQTLLILLPSD